MMAAAHWRTGLIMSSEPIGINEFNLSVATYRRLLALSLAARFFLRRLRLWDRHGWIIIGRKLPDGR